MRKSGIDRGFPKVTELLRVMAAGRLAGAEQGRHGGKYWGQNGKFSGFDFCPPGVSYLELNLN